MRATTTAKSKRALGEGSQVAKPDPVEQNEVFRRGADWMRAEVIGLLEEERESRWRDLATGALLRALMARVKEIEP